MKSAGILTVVVSLGLLFQGCSQGTDSNKRSTRDSGSSDAVVAAKQMTTSDLKGKGDADEPKDTVGGDEQSVDGKGKGTVDAGKVEMPIPGGKGNDNDDDGKGKTDTVQNPGQNPGQKPNDPVDDDKPVDVPPVHLPKKACVYFDPDMPEFFLKKDQFGANLPPVDVASHLIKGEVQADDATYIGEFTVFQEKRNSPNFMAKWDGKTGRIPHDYTMVVVNSADDSCTAYVRFVKQEPRTNNGCFAQHTKIKMFDGTDRVIALINVGDVILNPVTKMGQKVAEVRKGKEAKAMYKLAFGGTTVTVTETHPMPVKGGIKMAKDVTDSDYMFDANGVIHRVSMAKKLPVNPDQIVLNIRLESESADPMQHMVLAEGIVSGDLFLQRKMENPAATAAK